MKQQLLYGISLYILQTLHTYAVKSHRLIFLYEFLTLLNSTLVALQNFVCTALVHADKKTITARIGM